MLLFCFLVHFSCPGPAATEQPSVPPADAEDVEFDNSFLYVSDKSSVDLSRFAKSAAAMPGTYLTAVYINNRTTGQYKIRMVARPDGSIYACLDQSLLKKIPFAASRIPPGLFSDENKPSACSDLQKKFPQAQVIYDSNEQRLDINVPQIYLTRTARGATDPSLWDSGIPALPLGYTVSAWRSESRGEVYQSAWGTLNAGLNLGSWYLRHNGSASWQEHQQGSYSSLNTYVQRDVPFLQGRMLAGQTSTPGEIFDTLPFTGVQLASDDRMLPDALRGYAPEIRGIARTTARVSVRQNDRLIYETTVSPGEFLINDLYPAGYGSDLAVTVHESDGTEQNFSVPYSAIAQLLRPGNYRYDFTAGKIRSSSLRSHPALWQASWQQGISNAVTGWGGLQLSDRYAALQLGAAIGTEVGAFALDVTHSRDTAPLPGSQQASGGESYRLSYSKIIEATNSNLSLSAWRFSTKGYQDLLSTLQDREAFASDRFSALAWRARQRLMLTAIQTLPDGFGQFTFSGYQQDYWNRDGNTRQFQLSYSNRFGPLSWGLSANRTWSSTGIAEDNYLLNFSFPLGRSDTHSVPQLRVDLTRDGSGRYAEQATVSGSVGRDNPFSYGVTAARTAAGSSMGSVTGSYRSQLASISSSLSKGTGYQSGTLSLSGTVLAHAGGLTLTPYTSDTFALVEARGAEGARVSSYPGIYVDHAGFAAVPYLDAYQINEVSIDPVGASSEVELENTTQQVVPRSGAVVAVKYATRQGTPLLINALYDGEPVRFGAEISDSDGTPLGSVGQAGQIYVRVSEMQGQLRVKWGEGQDGYCTVNYLLQPAEKARSPRLQRFDSPCEKPGPAVR
ncbi:fimbria/pilus outer membrane usher protein [Pantoea sp. BAV 3049]|uniref:fimbria/pilus outer membrane usher protein n=1 Tax=Pantoea sp. BAV 3049 TaxID=2654188 RepID=UPI001E5F4977|nr:fimbria/pilus outer membrane usher protein [Pantoea sp. BAV 3049]